MKKFDSCYDRQQARNLAAQLAGKTTTVTMPRPGAIQALVAPIPAEPPSAGFGDPEIYRDEVWRLLLSWALELIDGISAFVCDGCGLIVAEQGDVPPHMEEIPSMVVTVLEKTRTAAGTGASRITLQLGDHWLTAFPLDSGAPRVDQMVIGLLSKANPSHQIINRINEVLAQKLAQIQAPRG